MSADCRPSRCCLCNRVHSSGACCVHVDLPPGEEAPQHAPTEPPPPSTHVPAPSGAVSFWDEPSDAILRAHVRAGASALQRWLDRRGLLLYLRSGSGVFWAQLHRQGKASYEAHGRTAEECLERVLDLYDREEAGRLAVSRPV